MSREAFEEAYGELVFGAPFELAQDGTTYLDVDTDISWRVWQAALSQRERCEHYGEECNNCHCQKPEPQR